MRRYLVTIEPAGRGRRHVWAVAVILQHSSRMTEQYRVCFVWQDGDAQ